MQLNAAGRLAPLLWHVAYTHLLPYASSFGKTPTSALLPRLLQLPGVGFQYSGRFVVFSAVRIPVVLHGADDAKRPRYGATTGWRQLYICLQAWPILSPRCMSPSSQPARYQQRTIFAGRVEYSNPGCASKPLSLCYIFWAVIRECWPCRCPTSTICFQRGVYRKQLFIVSVHARNIPAGDAGAKGRRSQPDTSGPVASWAGIARRRIPVFLAGKLHGNYPQAMTGFLTVEIIAMLTHGGNTYFLAVRSSRFSCSPSSGLTGETIVRGN